MPMHSFNEFCNFNGSRSPTSTPSYAAALTGSILSPYISVSLTLERVQS